MTKTEKKWPWPEPGPTGFRVLIAAAMLAFLAMAGCGSGSGDQDWTGPRLTYTYDQQTGTVLGLLASRTGEKDLKSFVRRFAGITIPAAEWEREPYVLALATRSRVPAILFLDAPWVKRYGHAGWLEDLRGDPALDAVYRQIPPSLLAAFSLEGRETDRKKQQAETGGENGRFNGRAPFCQRQCPVFPKRSPEKNTADRPKVRKPGTS